MMRKGELAEHRVPDVLAQVAAERLDGQIDLDGDRPVTIHLAGGRVSLVCWQDDPPAIDVDDEMDDATYSRRAGEEEARLRDASIEVLRAVVDRVEGWYYHDPLGEHLASALWGWEVGDLLTAVRGPSAEVGPPEVGPDPAAPALAGPVGAARVDPSAGRPAPGTGVADGRPPAVAVASVAAGPSGNGGRAAEPPAARSDGAAGPAPTPAAPAAAGDTERFGLSPTPPTEPLDDAAWAVVVALAGSMPRAELADRLGWPAVQAEIVTSSMVARGILTVDDG